jgi:hypothetical protein
MEKEFHIRKGFTGHFPLCQPASTVPQPIFTREPSLPFITASSSLTDGARRSGPFSPNSPLLCARVATLAKIDAVEPAPITTSTLQCYHLCACVLEPSHHLLIPCSIVSTLPAALLPPIAVPTGTPCQELDDEALRSLSHWPS